MADVKVSDLQSATQLNDTDLLMIVQSNENKKVDIDSLATTSTLDDSDLLMVVQDNKVKKIAKEDLGIEQGTNYSTTETVIGTWVDGKPLYRQVIYKSSLVNGTQLKTGVKYLINSYGYVRYSNDLSFEIYYQIPMMESNAFYYNLQVTNNIVYFATQIAQYLSGYIVLEYTKTSDYSV